MKLPSDIRSRLALSAVLAAILVAFACVALRTGPLAPHPVTVATVEHRSIAPALYGIGTVEARHSWKIGPTTSGRLRRLDVEVGERVMAGQVFGEALDDKVRENRVGTAGVAAAQANRDASREEYSRR